MFECRCIERSQSMHVQVSRDCPEANDDLWSRVVKHGHDWSRVVSNTICSLFQASKCLKCVFIRPRLRKLQSTEDIGSGRAWSSMVKSGQEWSRVVSNTIFSLFQAPKCLQGVIMRPRLCTLQLTEDIGSGQAWSGMVKSGQ